MPLTPDYRTDIVTSLSELDALRGEWDRVHGCSLFATPFNTWSWMATWWKVFRRKYWELRVICIYGDGCLIGIIPLYRRPGLLGWNLYFLGTGERERDEVVTEYCDLLIDPRFETEILRDGWQLISSSGGGSALHTVNLLSSSLVGSIEVAHVVRAESGVRFRIALPPTWDDFLARCSANMRRQIRIAEKDAAASDTSEEVYSDWNAGGADAFEILHELHQARWQDKNTRGAFASKLFSRFHREIVRHHADTTGCEIRIIRARGAPVAALYNFRMGETVYFYQGGVKPVAHFRSPGVYSHSQAIKKSIEDGSAYYDMMRGDISSYKKRFPCEIRPMQNISFFSSSSRRSLSTQPRLLTRWLLKLLMSKLKN